MTRVAGWTLRIAAWALMAAVVARLALQGTQVDVIGRLYQLDIRGERARASANLLRKFGLDTRFPAARYELFVPRLPREIGLPTWLALADRSEMDFTQRIAYLYVDSNGTCVWPPLTNPQRSPGQGHGVPQAIRVPTATDQTQLAAVSRLGDGSSRSEYRVWLHARDRWINVLRLSCTGFHDVRCRPDGVLEFGDPILEFFVWYPGQQRFLPPDLPSPAIQVLPLIAE